MLVFQLFNFFFILLVIAIVIGNSNSNSNITIKTNHIQPLFLHDTCARICFCGSMLTKPFDGISYHNGSTLTIICHLLTDGMIYVGDSGRT